MVVSFRDGRECLKNLLPHIRFPTLTEEQLVSLVIPTEILTKAEIVSIFTYQAAKNRQE